MKKIEPNDPEAVSADLTSENIARLKELFPEAWVEGQIDFDALKQALGGTVDERDEKYGLNWHGKRRAKQIAQTPSTGTLRPSPEESVDWDTTQNLMIEGDNLEVLKLLQKSYAGKVKLIYIDPPYNTGKDFVYPDDFRDSIKNYQEITGQIEDGKKTSSNVESSGRFHTDWLNMMYPRLRLARNLLSENGIICISMDDNEIASLKLICDDIFGETSFIGTLTWITTTQPDNIGRARFGLQQNLEYVLMYSKCGRIDLPPFVLEAKENAPKYPHTGKFGACRFEIIERAFEGAYARPTMRFEILGQKPREGKQWQIGEKQARDLETKERVEIVDGIVKKAVYPEDEADEGGGFIPFWAHLRRAQTSQAGKAELTNLLGPGHGVDTVKPVSLISEILAHLPNEGLVLDFFAGSGTTGHAVLEANALDQGTRRVILAQLPLPLDIKDSRQRSSAEFCDSIQRPRTLAEITKERLRRAGKQVRDDHSLFVGDTGFRVFKLDSSNIRTWDPDVENLKETLLDAVDHIKPGRTEADILYEVILKLGMNPTQPVDQKLIADKQVYRTEDGKLLACLFENISRNEVEALAMGLIDWNQSFSEESETTVIFRDSAFVDDVSKANLTAILVQYGFDEKRIRSL